MYMKEWRKENDLHLVRNTSVHKTQNMLSLLILLLSSGGVVLASQYERAYVLINTLMTWDDAQTYCRENHIDLATIRNRDDMTRMANTPSEGVSSAWIGLKKNGVASWQWSVGETQSSDGLVNYTNWASLPDSSHDCGGMRDDGKWLSAPCGNLNPFVCRGAHFAIFTDEGSSEMYVVLQAMSWRKARAHCQLNYGDLVSVMNAAENQAAQQKAGTSSLTFFWIGVFKDEWKWSDESSSSYRHWDSTQPNNDGICTLYYPSSKTMWDRGCTSTFPFYCSTVTFRRQIVSVKIRSNSIVDFSDSAVSKAILSQIQNKNDRLKLQWTVQPDGEIFHKKEDKVTEVIEAC